MRSLPRPPRAPRPLPLLGLALLAACGAEPTSGPDSTSAGPGRVARPDPAAERGDWPAGTVLAVDGLPISVDEIDLASVWVERIDPKAAERQLRRLALANVVLPRTLAELSAPEERARARAEAEAQLARLRAGGAKGPPGPDGGFGTVGEGNWQVLGIPLWGQATDWPADEWHLVEEPGRFVVARRLARVDLPHPTALAVRVDTFLFPYLPPELDLEAAIDEHRLTIVDPLWREIVPERTQYRMGVHAP